MIANQKATIVNTEEESPVRQTDSQDVHGPNDEPRLVGELLDFSEVPVITGQNFVPTSPSTFDLLSRHHGDISLDSLRRVLVPVECAEKDKSNSQSLVVQSGNAGHDYGTVPVHCKEIAKPQLSNREHKHERPHVFVDTSHAKTSVQVMKHCMEDLGWYEIKNHFQHGSMRSMRVPDIFWHAVSFEDTPCIPFSENIRINKFPGMVQIVRKQSLTYAIRRLCQFYPSEFSYYPRSWNIPEEYPQLVFDHEQLTKGGKGKNFWLIFKPDDASQGNGIFLEDNPRNMDTNTNRNYLVQQYITNPLLIDGLKFDFRIYVLLRNLNNVEIFLSREGMVRFCTLKYEEPSGSNKSKVYMHLTNYSLNKYSETYDHNNSMSRGSKRLLSSVFNYLKSEGYNVDQLWTKIENITVKTVFAILPDLLVAYRDEIPPNKEGPRCFQILGFDILIDENFEPHLLEVNANPSLNLDHEVEIAEDGVLIGQPAPNHPGYQLVPSQVDEEIKRPVVLESLLLACPIQHRSKTLKFLTKYGVQFAVHYPDGQFSNNEDPIRQEPCLYLVYNCKDSSLDKFRFLEDLVKIYVFVLGNRTNRATQSAFRSYMSGTMTLSWSKADFRRFIRKTRLTVSGGATAASVDLLFIKMTRKWYQTAASNSSQGLSFDSFLGTFIELAERRYKDLDYSLLEKVKLMSRHCIMSLQMPDGFHWYPATSIEQDLAALQHLATRSHAAQNPDAVNAKNETLLPKKEEESGNQPNTKIKRASSLKVNSLSTSKNITLDLVKPRDSTAPFSNKLIPVKSTEKLKSVSKIPRLNHKQSNFPIFSALEVENRKTSPSVNSKLPSVPTDKNRTRKGVGRSRIPTPRSEDYDSAFSSM